MTQHRAALVTGASRGIGRAIALALAERGWDLVLNYRASTAAAEEVAAAARAAGAAVHLAQADVADLAAHPALVDAATGAFGRLDLLVNNAGVAPETRADLLEATPESFDRVLAVNLRGPYFLTQRVARAMLEMTERGVVERPAIVNIGSLSSYAVSTSRGEYCVSKAGLAMMTQLFADRLAPHGIQVFEVRPGIISTDMTGPVREKYSRLITDGLTPIQRWGEPEEVALAVVAVADGLLPFSTGQILDVDGGFHVRRL